MNLPSPHKTQLGILLVVEAGICVAFAVMAVHKFLTGSTAIGLVCVAGVLYVGFRAWQAGRALFRMSDA